MAKLARAAAVVERFCSANNGTTIAVEDIANAAPMISDACGD